MAKFSSVTNDENLEKYETIQKRTPKKRGRKPKEVIVNALSCSPTPNVEMRQPVARGRGRPPKDPLNTQKIHNEPVRRSERNKKN